MMEPVIRVDGRQALATLGTVELDWCKIIWRGGLLIASIVLAPIYFTWSAFAVFLIMSYITLLLGHSIGMHRMMIHRSFSCSKPLERVLIYLGVLVGMGGPFGIIKTHDVRDWAQRQPECHDFFAHTRSYFRDVSWQLFYRFEFQRPPKVTIEKKLGEDGWLQFFESTWPLHQVLLAALLFYFGGMPWVVWGVFVRIIVSIIGHWSITYFCHNPGPGRWKVKKAGVQASNLPAIGFLTHGECWHNNHHAFPESARIGLEKGQIDTGWNVIRFLEKVGLAKNVGRPRVETKRDDLVDLHNS